MTASKFDNTQAFSEGWGLFNNVTERRIEIQRVDCPEDERGEPAGEPVFKDDTEALLFVICQATMGSEYHQDAFNRITPEVPA